MTAEQAATASAPSIARRVVLTVLAAFLVVYGVLYATIAYESLRRESGDFDRGLLNGVQGLADALDEVDTQDGARAAMALFRGMMEKQWNPASEPAPPALASVRLDGTQRDAQKLPAELPLHLLPNGVSEQRVQGTLLRFYVASGRLWKVVIADNAEQRDRWALRSLLGDLGKYLLIALPFVLLPVWLSVRAALKPVRRLSELVGQRKPQDTSPLVPQRSYRELRPLELSLNRLFERVGQGLAREKAFVNDAAHELRTPLAVISAQAHVLADSEGADRATARQRLQAAIERASHLTHQLLRLAQADALAQAQRQPVDVMNVARDTLAGFAERAAAQGAELVLNGADSVMLATDRQALQSILENLVDNALRYGGPGVMVDVHVLQHDGALQIWVADNGPGIAREEREKVFDRFWRGRKEDQRGAGLGLAIVREAVRALGGDVHVEDGLQGRGCAVVVDLR